MKGTKLVGDVRVSDDCTDYINQDNSIAVDFLIELEKLMEQYQVTKVDVSWDIFKIK